MMLQVNTKGAWRNVVSDFKAKDMNAVRDAAQFLAKVGHVRGMQIVDDGIEVAWCMSPDYQWEAPGMDDVCGSLV